MTADVPITGYKFYTLLRSEYPDIDPQLLLVNAKTLSLDKPLVAAAIARIIQAPVTKGGRAVSVALIRDSLMLTMSYNAYDRDTAAIPTAERIKWNVGQSWSFDNVCGFMSQWNFGNVSQEIHIDAEIANYYHDKISDAWIDIGDDFTRDEYWRGLVAFSLFRLGAPIPLLHEPTPQEIHTFAMWAGTFNDLWEAANLAIDRSTADPVHLEALRNTSSSTPSAVREGVL